MKEVLHALLFITKSVPDPLAKAFTSIAPNAEFLVTVDEAECTVCVGIWQDIASNGLLAATRTQVQTLLCQMVPFWL